MAVFMVLGCILLFYPAATLSQGQWVFERSWGQFGSSGQPFSGAVDVKVGGNGLVYVSDVGSNNVQVFTPDGTYTNQWGTRGSGDGQFLGTEGLAIDEQGIVFVADDGNCRVQSFSPEGDFLSAWPSVCENGPGGLLHPRLMAARGGFLYVVVERGIEKFTVDGTFLLEMPDDYRGVATAEDGTVWATVAYRDLVRHLTPEGKLLQEWSAVPPGAEYANPIGIDLDGEGNLYIANGVWGTVEKFAPDGRHLDTIQVVYDLPRGLDVVNDRELYVVGVYGGFVIKYAWQSVAVEGTSWGTIKRCFLH